MRLFALNNDMILITKNLQNATSCRLLAAICDYTFNFDNVKSENMRVGVCMILCLLMRFVAFSQLRLNAPVRDTMAYSAAPVQLFNTPVINTFQNKQVIPLDLYTQHLSFFCRQELKMQQAHVPVTFRLGSMDQCNYLEQKPGYKIN